MVNMMMCLLMMSAFVSMLIWWNAIVQTLYRHQGRYSGFSHCLFLVSIMSVTFCVLNAELQCFVSHRLAHSSVPVSMFSTCSFPFFSRDLCFLPIPFFPAVSIIPAGCQFLSSLRVISVTVIYGSQRDK